MRVNRTAHFITTFQSWARTLMSYVDTSSSIAWIPMTYNLWKLASSRGAQAKVYEMITEITWLYMKGCGDVGIIGKVVG